MQGTEKNKTNTEPESVGTAVVIYVHKARCALYLFAEAALDVGVSTGC
jgi:hypothetical protein